MKKIEDYLHLYLGCDVLLCKNIEGNDVIESLTKEMLFEDSDMFDFEEGIIANLPYKLILRPLSDMSEEEGINYAQFYCKKPIPKNCAVLIEPKYDYVHVSIKLGEYGLSLFPGGPHGDKAEAVHYLLSKHFDLFGLIEAGLAIDKTILK